MGTTRRYLFNGGCLTGSLNFYCTTLFSATQWRTHGLIIVRDLRMQVRAARKEIRLECVSVGLSKRASSSKALNWRSCADNERNTKFFTVTKRVFAVRREHIRRFTTVINYFHRTRVIDEEFRSYLRIYEEREPAELTSVKRRNFSRRTDYKFARGTREIMSAERACGSRYRSVERRPIASRQNLFPEIREATV